MTFLELDIGDYFIKWDDIDDSYNMYRKNSEYDAHYVDRIDIKLIECYYGVIKFGCDDIVYKVVV